jgi:hypothetical protein
MNTLTNHPTIRHVSFAGGGSRGLAFAKAVETFETGGWLRHVETYSGCSIGALVAALLAVGYTGSELCAMVLESNMEDFININLMNVFALWGLDSGERLVEFVEGKLRDKTGRDNVTMKDVPSLTVVATNLNTAAALYCSASTTPELPVSRAVRMSMALPPLFSSVTYNGNVYIDGGLVDNLPVLYEPSATLVFQVAWKNAFSLDTIDNYFSRVVYVGLYRLSLQKKELKECHVCRIDGGNIATLNLRVCPGTKAQLFANARQAAEETMARRLRSNASK